MRTEAPHYAAWLRAEQEAQAAERELHAALVQRARRGSTPLPPGLAESAHELRTRAHALFEAAMREMRDLAEALHHRRIVTSGAPEAARGGDGGPATAYEVAERGPRASATAHSASGTASAAKPPR